MLHKISDLNFLAAVSTYPPECIAQPIPAFVWVCPFFIPQFMSVPKPCRPWDKRKAERRKSKYLVSTTKFWRIKLLVSIVCLEKKKKLVKGKQKITRSVSFSSREIDWLIDWLNLFSEISFWSLKNLNTIDNILLPWRHLGAVLGIKDRDWTL